MQPEGLIMIQQSKPQGLRLYSTTGFQMFSIMFYLAAGGHLEEH